MTQGTKQNKALRAAIVFLLGIGCPLVSSGQTPSGPLAPVGSAVTAFDWESGLGYPSGVAVGGQVGFVRTRAATVPGRGSHFRGVELGASVGLGAGMARASWTNYFEYDAGKEGWSIDAVYLQPWLVSWGPERGRPYLGAGGSWVRGYARFSGALVTRVSGARRSVVPVLQVALSMPPWQ